MSNPIPPHTQVHESPVDEADSLNQASPITIPVIQEQIQLDKQVIETGTVRIRKEVSEEVQSVDLPIFQEEVTVNHVAVYQYVDSPPPIRYEGETMIIPVLREVLVTEKRLLLVEEVHVTKRHITTQETQQVTLRKEEITVERSGVNPERSA